MLLEQHQQKTEFLDYIAARQAYLSRLALHSKEAPPKMKDFLLLGPNAQRGMTPAEHLRECERIGIKIETI